MPETMDAPEVLFEKPRDGVLLITLNRPQQRNAFSNNSWKLIAEALTEAERDDDIRCVVYTGGPKDFAAGSDLTQMQSSSAPTTHRSPAASLAAMSCQS